MRIQTDDQRFFNSSANFKHVQNFPTNLNSRIPSCCIISHFERFSRLTGLSDGDDVINRVLNSINGSFLGINGQWMHSCATASDFARKRNSISQTGKW